MTYQLTEDALGDHRNAQVLAVASDVAYMTQDEGSKGFREQFGMDAKLFSVGNTQAFVCQNDDHILVAFRGTEEPTSIEGLKDWLLTDACNLLILPAGRMGTDFAAAGVDARYHKGFMDALTDIWGPVSEAVDTARKSKDRPIWITGHSLGGALAQLACWLFTRKFISIHQAYTFGAPMIGNAVVSKAFEREMAGKIYRYVNSPDPVPKLPTFSLIANSYTHSEKEIAIGAAAGNPFESWVSKTVDGIISGTIIDDIWSGLMQRVNAHFMTSYRPLIDTLAKGA